MYYYIVLCKSFLIQLQEKIWQKKPLLNQKGIQMKKELWKILKKNQEKKNAQI